MTSTAAHELAERLNANAAADVTYTVGETVAPKGAGSPFYVRRNVARAQRDPERAEGQLGLTAA